MQNTYFMNLNEKPFTLIKNEEKVVEMRLFKGERRNIKEDDYIVFTNEKNGEKLKVRVLSVSRFPSFKELYEYFDKKLLGYKDDEIASFKDMNEYYSDDDISKYGVMGISIKLIKN